MSLGRGHRGTAEPKRLLLLNVLDPEQSGHWVFTPLLLMPPRRETSSREASPDMTPVLAASDTES